MRFIHLTDPHLSNLDDEKFSSLRGKRWSGYLSWRKNRRHRYLPAVLEKLVSAVRVEAADHIILTGDLVQIGLDTEISQATEWLKNLGSPDQVMLVPGNHDVYAPGSEDSVNRAWSEYMFAGLKSGNRHTALDFPVLRKFGKLSFISLTSACVTPVFMASGKLGSAQINRLAALLEQSVSEGQLVSLLIHHPPLSGMTSWRKGLTDADRLQIVLKNHPPAMVFHGHLHHNRELQWHDSHIFCTAAASSASDASYRVVDVEECVDSWKIRMALKSIALEVTGEPDFVVVDEQRWEIAKV